jgi:protein associated with RNAse G/E
VLLFPRDRPWAASYYDSPEQPVSVSVDVATPAVWDGPHVTMVDLDLDVIRTRDGDVLLDDEDEFDEHRVTLGYPADVVALARRTADDLMTAAVTGHEPFGETGGRWLARLAATTP